MKYRLFTLHGGLFDKLPASDKIIFVSLAILFLSSLFALVSYFNSLVSVEVIVSGGKIQEGVVGVPTTLNPLYAKTQVERDISSLLYSGLTKPDGKGWITNDLSEEVDISEDGTVYTFTLREDISFHDGTPITSKDVLFTLQQTQRDDAQPYLKTDGKT